MRSSTHNAYSERVNLTGTLDAQGRTARLSYDALGRLERRIDIGSGLQPEVSEWIWDGGPDGVDPGTGEILGQVTETRSPDSVTRRFEFDAVSGLPHASVDEIDGASFRTSITRDEFQRVDRIQYPQVPSQP